MTGPIERYVRAQVTIGWYGNPCLGTIEIGLHYEQGDQTARYRSKLVECAKCAFRDLFAHQIQREDARWPKGDPEPNPLDEHTADALTSNLDARIVALWGDRPRFIEIWRGTGDDAEPLTQIYAPHGMPRQR